MRTWTFVTAGLLSVSGMSEACSPDIRRPGDPITAPYAAFDARVIEVHEEMLIEDGKPTPFQLGTLEVTRSLQGPHKVGDTLPTRTDMQNSCADQVHVGMTVRMEIWPGWRVPYFVGGATHWAHWMLTELANLNAESRTSAHPELTGVTLRGEISDRAAAKLLQRAQPAHLSGCEVRRADRYAQVSCGRAYDGNDAALRVVFERVGASWKEVMRYRAPATNPAAASAATTS
jgi:hypothetical protein